MVNTQYMETLEKFFRSNKSPASALEMLNTHQALYKYLEPGDLENMVITVFYRSQIPFSLCGNYVGLTVRDWVDHHSPSMISNRITVHYDQRIIKEFSMNGTLPWMSWQEFAKHKNVRHWVLTENHVAIGLNENPALGLSIVAKTLDKSGFAQAWAHFMNYEQYIRVNSEEV